MVIDFHTHIFPDKIAERTIEILEQNMINSGKTDGHAFTRGKLSELKQSMQESGVNYSVVLPIATNVHQSVSINNFASQINGKDNIFSFGSLHPMQEDWESVLYDIKEKGLKGIKLHPEYQSFYIDSPESVRILKKCEELDLIVVLHAGFDVGVLPPAHCMPENLRHVLDYEISGEKVIAAHLGGWSVWDDVEKYLVGTPIMLDTAYIMDFVSKEQFIRIIRNHGAQKILFATDSPWENPKDTLKFINSLEITESEREKILYKNAEKLLSIN